MLGAEVDHPKRDQAWVALTPAPSPPPTQTPRAWDSHPEPVPRAGCALTISGWDLPPAGVWLGPVPWDGEGLPVCSGGQCRDWPPLGAQPSQPGSLTATPAANHVPFPWDSCPAARTATSSACAEAPVEPPGRTAPCELRGWRAAPRCPPVVAPSDSKSKRSRASPPSAGETGNGTPAAVSQRQPMGNVRRGRPCDCSSPVRSGLKDSDLCLVHRSRSWLAGQGRVPAPASHPAGVSQRGPTAPHLFL